MRKEPPKAAIAGHDANCGRFLCAMGYSGADFDPEKAIIVGDSLSSDIKGGINAGIRTCWVNPDKLPGRPDIRPDYEIAGIYQLEELLKTL